MPGLRARTKYKVVEKVVEKVIGTFRKDSVFGQAGRGNKLVLPTYENTEDNDAEAFRQPSAAVQAKRPQNH